jgi:hypothetical protein
MTAPELRPHLWGILLVLLLGVSCRESNGPSATPSPTAVVRAGELYTCSNGVDGCRVTYRIGPVAHLADRVRVYFTVTLDGPGGGTTSWTNDTTYHAQLKSQGQRGIVLTRSSDDSVFYELAAVGGIAAVDETLVAPVTHFGFWEFVVSEPADALLLLTYPDFQQSPAPIAVPE